MLPVAMAKQGAQEVEWQFDAVDIRPVERWLVQSLAKPASMSVTPACVQTIVDTYTDTDDWRLYRAGYSLRIRRTVSRFEATLKGLDAAVDGLRLRQEISQPVASADLSGLPAEGGPVGDRVRAMIGNSHLEPLFQVRTRRKIFQLDAGGAPAAEIVLDQTTIPVADGHEPARLRRVEVEARGVRRGHRLNDLLPPTEAVHRRVQSLQRGLEPPHRAPDPE